MAFILVDVSSWALDFYPVRIWVSIGCFAFRDFQETCFHINKHIFSIGLKYFNNKNCLTKFLSHSFCCRDEVFCGVWAWNPAYGRSSEIHLWAVHRLCTKESLLWNGDAHQMRAFWYQLIPSRTEGSCCLVGTMTCTLLLLCVVTFLCKFSKQTLSPGCSNLLSVEF